MSLSPTNWPTNTDGVLINVKSVFEFRVFSELTFLLIESVQISQQLFVGSSRSPRTHCIVKMASDGNELHQVSFLRNSFL